MNKEDKLYWVRIGLAVIAAIVSLAMGFTSENPLSYLAIFVAAIFYFISFYIAKYMIRIRFPKDKKRRLYTIGIGSYAMMFLFIWTLINTIMLTLK